MNPDLADHLRAVQPTRVVYADLDGTMLGYGGAVVLDADGRPFPGAVQALVAAASAGVEVVPVTGRRGQQLREDMKLLGLANGIGEAGGVVVGRTGPFELRWGACPRDGAASPRDALQQAGALDVVMEVGGDALRRYEPWDRGRVGGFLLHGEVDVQAARSAFDAAGLGWVRLVDNGVTGGWPERDVVHAYHLIPRGVGKAEAVSDDLAQRGLSARAAVAIGDSPEDARIGEVVGTYIAVGNATTPVGGSTFRVEGRASRGFAEAMELILAAVAEGPPVGA